MYYVMCGICWQQHGPGSQDSLSVTKYTGKIRTMTQNTLSLHCHCHPAKDNFTLDMSMMGKNGLNTRLVQKLLIFA